MKRVFLLSVIIMFVLSNAFKTSYVYGTVCSKEIKNISKTEKSDFGISAVKTIFEKTTKLFEKGINSIKPSTGDRSWVITLLLLIFLWEFGAHNFYLGYTRRATIELLCFLFSWLLIPFFILMFMVIKDLVKILTRETQPVGGIYLD